MNKLALKHQNIPRRGYTRRPIERRFEETEFEKQRKKVELETTKKKKIELKASEVTTTLLASWFDDLAFQQSCHLFYWSTFLHSRTRYLESYPIVLWC